MQIRSFLLGVLLALLISGCWDQRAAPNLAGNGSGYGGGDRTMTQARALLVKALLQFRDDPDLSTFPSHEDCQSKLSVPTICNLIAGLNPEQKTYLKEFLKLHVTELIDMNLGSSRVKLEFTSQELVVGSSSSNESRDLAAKTKLGRQGAITFQTDAVSAMNDWERLQLLTHELGHKLENAAELPVIDDSTPIRKTGETKILFSSGQLFLDILGATMVAYLASQTGKPKVGYSEADAVTCDSRTTGLLLASAPYFDGTTSGLEATGLHPKIKAVHDSQGDFTLTVWVRAFENPVEDLKLGEVIFSTMDFNNQSHAGLQLVRLQNGNLGVYAGTGRFPGTSQYRLFDSGIALSLGGFHLVTLQRSGDTLKTYVDKVSGHTDQSTYFQGSTNQNEKGLLVQLQHEKVGIGMAAMNQGSSRLTPLHNFKRWKGSIAEVQFFNWALSESELQTLFTCAPETYLTPTASSLSQPTAVPPAQTDGAVTSFLQDGTHLFIGGNFEYFKSGVRFGLAKIDTSANDQLDEAFSPAVFGLSINTLAVFNDVLFVGGNFTQVNGEERINLAAVNKNTGELLSWAPELVDEDERLEEIKELIVHDGQLFVLGDQDLDSLGRDFLAVYDLSLDGNGNITISINDWNPSVSGTVNAISITGNRLFAGGYFSSVDGTARGNIAAFDLGENPSLSSWNPSSDYSIYSLASNSTHLFLGGNLWWLGTGRRGCGANNDNEYLGAIDITGTNTDSILAACFPLPDDPVRKLSLSGDILLVRGDFGEISTYPRKGLAAFDISQVSDSTPPTLLNWTPETISSSGSSGTVNALIQIGDKVYLGGDFTKIKDSAESVEIDAPYFGSVTAPSSP